VAPCRFAAAFRAAGLVLWAAGVFTHADIRPDLFSVLFFSTVLYFLESRRLGKFKIGPRHLLGLFVLFALWTNFHAGFAFGLMLLAFYALELPPREIIPAAVSAGAGTLCNPYGMGPYRVMLDHWTLRGDLARYITEWQPITWRNAYHWPFWPILFLCCLLPLLRARKKLPWGLVAATFYFAYMALNHSRLASYFNVLAVPLIFCLGRDLGALKSRWAKPGLLGAGVIYGGYMAWVLTHFSWVSLFNDQYVPRAAAEFMARQKETVVGLRTYNPWEWGGYLGWRLAPEHKVFADGRYIFHHQLAEVGEATGSAEQGQALLARYGIEAALMRNVESRVATTKVYPDGKTKNFLRPWYLSFLPKERWALVYWDAQALFFVDRRRVSKKWLEAYEYRYVRPYDEAAFEEAMRLKEIPVARVKLEQDRHRLETALFSVDNAPLR